MIYFSHAMLTLATHVIYSTSAMLCLAGHVIYVRAALLALAGHVATPALASRVIYVVSAMFASASLVLDCAFQPFLASAPWSSLSISAFSGLAPEVEKAFQKHRFHDFLALVPELDKLKSRYRFQHFPKSDALGAPIPTFSGIGFISRQEPPPLPLLSSIINTDDNTITKAPYQWQRVPKSSSSQNGGTASKGFGNARELPNSKGTTLV